VFTNPKRIALAGAVSVVVVSFTVFWLFSLRSTYVVTGTLSPADVGEIVQIASRQRWQMVRYALVRREFKLLRPFLGARIDSVDGNTGPHGKASVRWSAGVDRDVQIGFNLVCEGTNGWKFERWFVIDRKQASKPSRPSAP
jgi:hypothetical protein